MKNRHQFACSWIGSCTVLDKGTEVDFGIQRLAGSPDTRVVPVHVFEPYVDVLGVPDYYVSIPVFQTSAARGPVSVLVSWSPDLLDSTAGTRLEGLWFWRETTGNDHLASLRPQGLSGL